MRYSKVKIFFAALALALSVSARAGTAPEKIAFPPPPDNPRIEYVRTLAKGSDAFRQAKGFMSRMWRSLLGQDKGEGQMLSQPWGVAAFGNRVYVGEVAAGLVVIFDRDEERAGVMARGNAAVALESTQGMTVDEEGKVYVADPRAQVVKVFSSEGDYVRTIGKPGKGKGEMGRPVDVAVDWGRKRVVVTDGGNIRVSVYDMEGNFKFHIGDGKGKKPGQFIRPVGVTVDKRGRIIVADAMSCYVSVFDKRGRFLFRFGECGNTIGHFGRIKGIAVDSLDNIYVVDSLFCVVQVFDPRGRVLMDFGRPGKVHGAFDLPSGIFIDRKDHIYVADLLNSRVEVYKLLDGTVPEEAESDGLENVPVNPALESGDTEEIMDYEALRQRLKNMPEGNAPHGH